MIGRRVWCRRGRRCGMLGKMGQLEGVDVRRVGLLMRLVRLMMSMMVRRL